MPTGSERFEFLGRGLAKVSRLTKREKALLPVTVRRSKTPLNFVCGNESVTHFAQSEVSCRCLVISRAELRFINIE